MASSSQVFVYIKRLINLSHKTMRYQGKYSKRISNKLTDTTTWTWHDTKVINL